MNHSPLTIAGLAFSLVFLALGLLAMLIFALRALAVRSPRRKAAAAVPDLDPELLAVLAAAAYFAVGAPVRIHRVHVHSERSGLGWERAGRMDIMLSHRMSPK
jgi:hypothetical protein